MASFRSRSSRRAALAAAALVGLAPTPARAVLEDLFWIGGSGPWDNPFAWSSTLGGPPGAGPPDSDDRPHFEDLTSGPLMIEISSGDVAHRIEVRNSHVTFDLNQNTLDLARVAIGQPPNTVLVDSVLEVYAEFGETSSLVLTDGQARSGFLGAQASSTGAVTLEVATGASYILEEDSPILNASGPGADLMIRGTVTLNQFVNEPVVRINNDAHLTVDGGVLGNQGHLLIGNLNSGGTLTVENSGNAGANNNFVVGDVGHGRVDLRTGGDFTSQGIASIGRAAAGVGTVNVTNPLSNWFFEDDLIIGDAGFGTVTISDDAGVRSFNSADAFLGHRSGSRGRLTISDGGSFSTGGSLYIGGSATMQAGTGMVRVEAGGRLDVSKRIQIWNDRHLFVVGGTLNAGSITSGSNGLLVLDDGGIINADAVQLPSFQPNVALNHGELNVSGGSLNTSVSDFGYGENATPVTVRLLDGARSDVATWRIGAADAGVAVTEVARSGATGGVFATSDIFVGGLNVSATGTLNITQGGRARANDDVSIGHGTLSSGSVLVEGVHTDGRRSNLQSIASAAPGDGEVEVARFGSATLTVRNGGLVQAFNNMSVASMPSGRGMVEVSGAFSGNKASIFVSNDLAVGGFATINAPGGNALVDIHDMGALSVVNKSTIFPDGVVNVHAGGSFSSGNLVIDGGTLRILDLGEGTEDATVNVAGATTVGGTGARIDLAGGVLRTASLDLGGAPARLDWTGGGLVLTGSGLSIGTGGLLGPELTLGPNHTLYVEGLLFVGDSGQLVLDGAQVTGNDEVILEDGASIHGSGTIVANLGFEVGGSLRPGTDAPTRASGHGNSRGGGAAGAIHIDGSYEQLASTGSMFIDLGGTTPATEHDVVHVTGSAGLAGHLFVSTITDFTPLPGQSFQILTYASRTGTFDEIFNITGFAGLSIIPDYGPTSLSLTMDALGGDANLDGVVNLSDFNTLAANFGMSGLDWLGADFTGDGLVNLADFNALAANFGMGAGAEGPTPQDWAALAAVVPEPSAPLLAWGAFLIASRRRRRPATSDTRQRKSTIKSSKTHDLCTIRPPDL